MENETQITAETANGIKHNVSGSSGLKKKTIYGIRTRFSDNDVWSEPTYYRTRGRRDKVGSLNRIIGGIRTHSFEEKAIADEVDEKCEC